MDIESVTKQQEALFRSLFEKHKGLPDAVASESLAHKELRYSKLCEIFNNESDISIHDIGMGMGHLYEYIFNHHGSKGVEYSGTDIVKEYYDYCVNTYPGVRFCLRNLLTTDVDESYDYVLLSGVFHQIGNTTRREWEQYMYALLEKAFKMARKGVAFNVLSEHVDFYRPGVYYCNLSKLTNFIVDNLSRFYSINHASALFEATVFVFQEQYIHSKHPEAELQKYFRD